MNIVTTPTIEPNSIINGEALAILKQIPDDSVDCCVTSPPYFNLRDYGTAAWEGGDKSCKHIADASKTKKFGNPKFNENRPSREETKIDGYYFKDICGICGAKKTDKQIGLESTQQEYIANLTAVFSEVKRVLKPQGTLWINIGDSYEKDKNLMGIPWRLAFSLQDAGWILRQDIIWAKGVSGEACKSGWSGNPMPESAKDRFTHAFEHIFLLTKNKKYYFDNEAVKEPCAEASVKDFQSRKTMDNKSINRDGSHAVRPDLHRGRSDYMPENFMRNRRDVWTIATRGIKDAHYASYPCELITNCLLAGCPEGGIVLDPFFGSGTTGIVAMEQNKNFIGIELSLEYVKIAEKRIKDFYNNELDFCLKA